jgi:hypothetical protein
VTIETTLARLTAGLAEDEAIARAADNLQCDSGWGIVTYEGSRGFTITPHIGHIHETESAHHAVRFGPDRVLRQVKKLRDATTLLADAVNGAGPEPDLIAVCTELAELLAGIYTEPTEES